MRSFKLDQIQKEQAGVELGLTQAETVSLELGLIKGLTKISLSCACVNFTNKARFNSNQILMSQKKKFADKIFGQKTFLVQKKFCQKKF